MQATGLSRKELKKIVRETFVDVLKDRKDLIEDAVAEALEDLGLVKAMEEGRTGEYVDAKGFKKKISSRLKRTK